MVVLLHESRCMRHSPGRLQRCAEFTNLTLAPLSQRISRRQDMNRLARFLILAALSFVLGFYVTPVGFAQAKSAGQKTTLRSEEHTSELQSHSDLVCRLLLEKKKEEKKYYRDG